ncbi:MAG: PQQ-binding-like beta-propeller repeat protein [Verrucomicrobiales bacterium]|nr:PQQ-binding-like beta-propeller repeat protein [Verrucomicrobiales bacterium]
MHSRIALSLASVLFSAAVAHAGPWPSWRGPHQDGTTTETAFPTSWSPTNNVRWRVDLPGPGNSTPIVWSNFVFVSQAVPKPSTRAVLALDRATGKVLWQTGALWEDPETTHEDNPFCAASPVTDGERVIAYFGSAGIYAIDYTGLILWRRDNIDDQKHGWGYSSSPVIHGDHVYVYHGPGPSSRLYALSKKSGKVTWQVPLPEPVPTERTDGFKGRTPGILGNFGSPLVATVAGRTQVILGFPESLRSYHADTGEELWRARGLNPLVYTTPLLVGNQVIAMGGFNGSSLAVRADGSGDVTATHRTWYDERSKKNRIGSAVAKGDHLYLINVDGFLECLEARTGRQVWEERLNGPGANDASWSSLTLAGDHLYALNKSGDGFVIKASPKFEVVSTNTVAEPLNSSVAMSDGELFIRTWKGLWCIGGKATP